MEAHRYTEHYKNPILIYMNQCLWMNTAYKNVYVTDIDIHIIKYYVYLNIMCI